MRNWKDKFTVVNFDALGMTGAAPPLEESLEALFLRDPPPTISGGNPKK